jgi:hypothetical protein
MFARLSRTAAWRSVILAGIAAVTLTGCGGKDEPTPIVVPGAIALSTSPATLNFAAGGGGSSTLTLTRSGGFSGDVALVAIGAPTGVTIAFSPTTIAAGSTSSTITVTSAGTVTPGSYPIGITGTGTGVTGAATLTLTVAAATSPAVSVSVAPTAASIVAGASGTATATIARTGGFTGAVAMTSSGAPTGVTLTFTPASIDAASSTSAIAIAVANTVAAGAYPITVTASGTGITAATATYTLTVTAAAVPTLAVAVAPTTTSIVAGASGSATATITRGGGFAGAVAMTSTGAPSGMTVVFTPASIDPTATTSAIAIAVGSGVAAGSYPIVVSAAGTGVTTATATLTVTVTAPSGGGGSVTLSYCAEDAPIWVAVQDGNGAWTRVTPNSGTNTYQFNIPSGRGGVAAVDTSGTGFDLSVFYATTAEFNGFNGTQALGTCGGKRVNGSVSNVANTQAANVSLGFASAFVIPITSTSFSLQNVASGPQDLFAARLNASTFRADKIILRRGLNIANNGSIPVLDFNASEAFAPASANVTVANLGADTANAISIYSGTRGSSFGFLQTVSDIVAASGARPFDAIPGTQLNSTELQQLFVTANVANSSLIDRFAGVYFRTPSDRTVTLGPVLSVPTVSRIAGGSYSRVRVQLPLQTEYNRFFDASFNQTSANRSATISATTGYNGTGAWDLSIPDLSSVSGWLNTWGLINGTAISWNVGAAGGVQFFIDASATEGSTFQRSSRESASPLP